MISNDPSGAGLKLASWNAEAGKTDASDALSSQRHVSPNALICAAGYNVLLREEDVVTGVTVEERIEIDEVNVLVGK